MSNFFTSFFNSSSSEEFENEIKKLWAIPESQWYEGRKIPCNKLVSNSGKDVIIKKLPLDIRNPNHFINIIKFKIEDDTYIYFEEIIMTSTKPIINWFQLEKFDKTLGENMFRTKLLLSSDNQAKTQGAYFMMLFEK